MRFNAKERDEAVKVLLCVARELGPVRPHVLIDTAAEQLPVDKTAVLAGWHHLLHKKVLDWRFDGSVVIAAEAEPNDSDWQIAVRAFRQHFADHPEPIEEFALMELIEDQTGLAPSKVGPVFHYLEGSPRQELEFIWGEDVMVKPTDRLRPPSHVNSAADDYNYV